MELYASMVENLDHHVGRLVSWLKDNGQYDNTLIVFMSDNGAAGEDFYNRGEYVDYLRANYDNAPESMGRPGSWVAYDEVWAEAGSAPFSRRKTYSREGGMVAPMIVRGPSVSARGAIEDAYVTVMDLAPTFIELAGASYPNDGSVRPMLGESMTGLLSGTADRVHGDDYVTTLYHANRGFVRRGRWKLVSLEPPFSTDEMQLFDILADPGETRDVRGAEPAIHAEMLALWASEKERLDIRFESERPVR
jgi:arylsulfatase